MATKCLTRPQARVFGILVEGASVRCLARPNPFDRKGSTCSLCRSQPRRFSPQCPPIRSFATRPVKRPPHQYSPVPSASSEDQVLDTELRKALGVVKTDKVPEEEAVQKALQICENLARSLPEPVEPPRAPPKPERGPTSNLLSLEEERSASKSPTPPQESTATPVRIEFVEKISETAYKIITDPKVFITPMVLSTYVLTQSILGRPESFPQIFDLYASKPIPRPNTSPIKYKDSSPNGAASSIPLVLAHTALTAAIERKNLALALSVIDTSVCTKAFQRNKLFRKAILPFSALALTPAAAYVLAQQLAQYQTSMDTQMATNMVFTGIVAYIGFTATIGVIAVTTANDQMDRITWAKGTPLRDRWLREDERALVDRVAGAWGFQHTAMRGEEEGAEWEALREWAGLRGMVLDAPELMEGME